MGNKDFIERRCSVEVTESNASFVSSTKTSSSKGQFRILDKDFIERRCSVEVTESNANMRPFVVTWNLDEPTASLL